MNFLSRKLSSDNELSQLVNFLLRRGSEDVAKQTNQPNHNSLSTKYCSTIEFSDIFMYFPSSSNFTNSISTEPQNAINEIFCMASFSFARKYNKMSNRIFFWIAEAILNITSVSVDMLKFSAWPALEAASGCLDFESVYHLVVWMRL